MCVTDFCLVVLSSSILNCGGEKKLLSCPVPLLSHHPHPPPVHLFPRPSALSLRSMRPCPIPDAEAHGKDGNNCPEQLYLPNGEVSRRFFVFPLTSPMRPGSLYSIISLLSTVGLLLQWLGYCPPVCLHSLISDFCISFLRFPLIALLMPTHGLSVY